MGMGAVMRKQMWLNQLPDSMLVVWERDPEDQLVVRTQDEYTGAMKKNLHGLYEVVVGLFEATPAITHIDLHYGHDAMVFRIERRHSLCWACERSIGIGDPARLCDDCEEAAGPKGGL